MLTRWQQFYLDDDRPISTPPSRCARLAAQVFLEGNKHLILDLACGVGRDTFYLAERGLDVVGVDAAESGLRLAKQRNPTQLRSPTFVQADARQVPFPSETFEGIYCFGLLHEFTTDRRETDVRAVMDEINRVLHPTGILVLTVLSGNPEQGLPHVRLFTEEMFVAATAGFRLIEKREFEDLGCTGRTDYRVWYGIFKRGK